MAVKDEINKMNYQEMEQLAEVLSKEAKAIDSALGRFENSVKSASQSGDFEGTSFEALSGTLTKHVQPLREQFYGICFQIVNGVKLAKETTTQEETVASSTFESYASMDPTKFGTNG